MRRHRSPDRGAVRAKGFTLIEIAVVIVVLSLLLAMIAGIATAMVGQQRREATRQRIAGVETAIALFVSQYKRLPCPARGNLPAADPSDLTLGLERRTGQTCDNSQQHGVVPWRTLGLAEPDITDGWGSRLTYRVAIDLVVDNAMDFTFCDPGGTGLALVGGRCDTSCTSTTFPGGCTPPSLYTASKGIRITNAAATPVTIMDPCQANSTGAAYVVISHGENAAGAYSTLGVLQDVSGAQLGTLEAMNSANNTFAPSTCPTVNPRLVDDFPNYTDTSSHFDDFVIRPSILTVATKAQLGPRAH